jgi:hypothetical protein
MSAEEWTMVALYLIGLAQGLCIGVAIRCAWGISDE